ncbi:MAG: NAD(+)/NADH kinase [Spirochaetia bacterium]|jgi:NAD+ kinase|nr:NAD(+)/NADH kinase [Spirochaetia bacterium]
MKNNELILIIFNPEKKEAEKMSLEIHEYLDSKKIENTVCTSKNIPDKYFNKKHRLVITLGGDGTVLYCSRIFSPFKTPIFAINFGEIGFITEIERKDWKKSLSMFLENSYQVKKHLMLKVSVYRKGEVVYQECCLNDSVITATGGAKMVNLVVYIDELHLGEYRADGIIVSTPTGSTAYSAAAGGPLMFPEMDAVVLTPICPYSLSNRAIVLPVDKRIRISVEKEQRGDLVLTTDGQEIFNLQKDDNIIIDKSNYRALIIKSRENLFFNKVKSKLNWSGGPNNA